MGKSSASNNVILFPVDRIVNPQQAAVHANVAPQTLDEIYDVYDILKARKVVELLEVVTPLLAQAFAAYGLNMMATDPRHFGLVQEAVRSLALSCLNTEHPLQVLSQKIFDVRDGELRVVNLEVKTRTKRKKKDVDDVKVEN